MILGRKSFLDTTYVYRESAAVSRGRVGRWFMDYSYEKNTSETVYPPFKPNRQTLIFVSVMIVDDNH